MRLECVLTCLADCFHFFLTHKPAVLVRCPSLVSVLPEQCKRTEQMRIDTGAPGPILGNADFHDPNRFWGKIKKSLRTIQDAFLRSLRVDENKHPLTLQSISQDN